MPKMRLDKFLSDMKIRSRSNAKKLIKDGKIKVNGLVELDASRKIDTDKDRVYLFDKELEYRKNSYFMLNKPAGVVSARVDNVHKTVIDLVPQLYRYKLFPVGRLDIETEGLMLLTDDGKFSHELLSPKKHIDKTYYAEISKLVEEEDIQKFAYGIMLDCGYKTMPAVLNVLEADKETNISKVEITIQEGKFHQIKRMVADIGAKVLYLKRIKMASLSLDESLAPGEYRELNKEEMAELKEIFDINIE